MVALHARQRTGRGQVVDSAIYEAVLALMESLLPEWSLAGYQRERTGSVLPNIAPSNVYPTSDGDLVLIAANQNSVFRRLAGVMGRPGLADDERYATHGARGAHMAELDDLISEWTATVTADGPAGRAARGRGARPAASTGPGTCSPTRTSPRARPSSGSSTRIWATCRCRVSSRG
jgi:Predicted acyl-CoA transferases/carnitine dehydratase